jgi:outer membrane protein assembly factor BamB
MGRTRTVRAGLVVTVAVGLAVSGCTSSASGSHPSAAHPSAPASAPSTPTADASVAPAPASTSAAPAGYPDWPTYHGNAQRTGVSTTMPAVHGALKVASALKLDGAVYASPIVARGTTVVATENDSVYAFDSHGRQLWRARLGHPSPADQRPCGDIDPLGITGTPIYDASTGTVYVVAGLGAPVRHELFALALATGAVRWHQSVDLPGPDPTAMQQRGALAISGGRVWVSFGALAGDCSNYKGRVVGVRIDGTGTPITFDPSTRRQGGIWNAAGPTIDATGHLLVVSANGSSFPGDAYDHTNSVLEVDPTSGRLLDSFAPTDWAQNNQGDVGLGSQGVALIGTTWAVLGGKSGPVYVLRQGHLGGIGGQVAVQDVCRSFGGAAVVGSVVYLPCTDGVRAIRIDGAGGIHVLWHADPAIAGSPVVGGGRIWALDQTGGVLHALDPATGRSLEQVSVGVTSRFATPALYGNQVLVPTMGGLTIVTT